MDDLSAEKVREHIYGLKPAEVLYDERRKDCRRREFIEW